MSIPLRSILIVTTRPSGQTLAGFPNDVVEGTMDLTGDVDKKGLT